MKGLVKIFFAAFISLVFVTQSPAQCSICTKTASQLGAKPARGLNAGILYLMATPLAVAGFVGLRWWKREKEVIRQESLS